MNIYISHSRSFDFRAQLYEPLLESELAKKHHFILPHQGDSAPYPFETHLAEVDLVIAEVSFPSTGQGIELGMAYVAHKPILCVYKQGTHPSASLSVITHELNVYNRTPDLLRLLQEKIA